jgi:hypothetical protein
MPFDQGTCQSLLKSYDEFGARFAALYLRQLHLTSGRVLAFREGQESPLTNAAYAWQANDDAVTFELALPLSALPRTATEELGSLNALLVRADTANLPDNATEQSRPLALAEPIRFGLDSDMLTCAGRFGVNYLQQPRFAYQPGESNRAYRTGYAQGSSFALELLDGPLSAREAVLGSFELRTVYGGLPVLAILNEGRLVDCQDIGGVIGVVPRGRGLHVIAYQEEYAEEVGLTGAMFKVLEIEKDGTIHDDLLEIPENGFGYVNVGEDHAKNLATFSIVGLYRDDGGTREHALKWRYDPRSNHYGLSERKGRFFADGTSP